MSNHNEKHTEKPAEPLKHRDRTITPPPMTQTLRDAINAARAATY